MLFAVGRGTWLPRRHRTVNVQDSLLEAWKRAGLAPLPGD